LCTSVKQWNKHEKVSDNKLCFIFSVSDPDPGGSGFKLPDWIRIRILEVKLSYKNPLFPQIFNDFHLFLKMIGTDTFQIKVLCLIKYLLDWLKTKIKYLLFGKEKKISPKTLLLPLIKLVFCCLDPDLESGLENKSRIRIRRKRILIRNTVCRYGTYQ